jgi:hypothetical protein
VAASTKPWGSFSQADYSDDQWKRACLLDHGTGNTPKERYGLPVREPSGALNANGMAAAAGRIHGVKAPPDKKKAAARKLVGLYRSEKMDVPPALLRMAS